MDYVTTEQFEKFLEEERDHHRAQDERTRALEVQVAAVGQQVAGLGVQLTPIQKQLEAHHKTLYGNGVPGMDENIRKILEWIEQQKADAEAAKLNTTETRKWWQSEMAKYVFWLVTTWGGIWLMSQLGLVK